MHILQPGLKLYKNYLSLEKQEQLVQIIHNILPEAPFFKAISPRKKPLGSLMTNMGEFGWYADATDGYRYINHHPNTQKKWPRIPVEIMNISLVFVGLIASVILGGMVVTYLNATNKSQFIKWSGAKNSGKS
jgi:alkylated DNA repair dioxygenase AlkB